MSQIIRPLRGNDFNLRLRYLLIYRDNIASGSIDTLHIETFNDASDAKARYDFIKSVDLYKDSILVRVARYYE